MAALRIDRIVGVYNTLLISSKCLFSIAVYRPLILGYLPPMKTTTPRFVYVDYSKIPDKVVDHRMIRRYF